MHLFCSTAERSHTCVDPEINCNQLKLCNKVGSLCPDKKQGTISFNVTMMVSAYLMVSCAYLSSVAELQSKYKQTLAPIHGIREVVVVSSPKSVWSDKS